MKLFHRHKWEPIAAQQGTFRFIRGDGTQVLEKCSCEKTRTRAINGHWTLDQLRGR